MDNHEIKNNGSTPDRILDAAEELFVELGYAATSLRAIANNASVNLAATNYHFGSKEGLLAAVIHRHIQPVNAERLRRLDILEDNLLPPSLREILETFFFPLAETIPESNMRAVMGRVLSEPESLTRPIIAEEFAEVQIRFQSAIALVMPELDSETLNWRFHLMIGSMIHILKFPKPLTRNEIDEPFPHTIERLVSYSIAGLSQQVANDNV